jgi:hypothetical protein
MKKQAKAPIPKIVSILKTLFVSKYEKIDRVKNTAFVEREVISMQFQTSVKYPTRSSMIYSISRDRKTVSRITAIVEKL